MLSRSVHKLAIIAFSLPSCRPHAIHSTSSHVTHQTFTSHDYMSQLILLCLSWRSVSFVTLSAQLCLSILLRIQISNASSLLMSPHCNANFSIPQSTPEFSQNYLIFLPDEAHYTRNSFFLEKKNKLLCCFVHTLLASPIMTR